MPDKQRRTRTKSIQNDEQRSTRNSVNFEKEENFDNVTREEKAEIVKDFLNEFLSQITEYSLAVDKKYAEIQFVSRCCFKAISEIANLNFYVRNPPRGSPSLYLAQLHNLQPLPRPSINTKYD